MHIDTVLDEFLSKCTCHLQYEIEASLKLKPTLLTNFMCVSVIAITLDLSVKQKVVS